MDKFHTNIFYKNSDIHSKNKKSLKVPNSVFRQELVTWEHTASGIKRTTVVRSFNGNDQIDSYISEPIAFKKAQ
jgi:hypothetical protein